MYMQAQFYLYKTGLFRMSPLQGDPRQASESPSGRSPEVPAPTIPKEDLGPLPVSTKCLIET